MNRIAPASSRISTADFPAGSVWRMKSTKRIELRTMIPASAMKPIIEVAENGAPHSQWPNMIPRNVSGTGVSTTSGTRNDPNCATTST